MDAGGPAARDLIRGAIAALGDDERLGRYALPQPQRSIGIDLEGVQVAIVHPVDSRTGGSGASHVGLIVYFHQRRRTQSAAERDELGKLRVTQRGDDE